MASKSVALALLAAASFTPAAVAQPAAPGPPLIQTIDDRPADRLYRVEPRTLALRPGAVRTFRRSGDVAFSPDRRLLAHASSRTSRIQLVDLARWRSLGISRIGERRPLTLAWPRQDRLVAVEGYARRRVHVFDVPSRRVVASHPVSGRSLDGADVPGGYALLTAPRRGAGPTRVLLVDAEGGLRVVELDRIEGGYDEGESHGRFLKPDIAVDSEGGYLYAVAADRPLVAAVELVSGAVTYHSLAAQASKGNVETHWRDAAWAGDGQIALTGERQPAAPGLRRPPAPVPFGLRLIDTRDWSIRTLDPRPNVMDLAGDTLLANGTRWTAGFRRSSSTGLLAFDLAGRRAFTRFRGKDVAVLASHGRLAYVWVRPERTLHVIDLGDGRTVATRRARPATIPFLLTPED